MIDIASRCNVINCSGVVVAKGLCSKHYKRLQRHSDVEHRVNADGSHPLYNVWRNIVRAKRGSLICERWQIFDNFVQDVVNKPEGSRSFERIDRSKVYEPNNVIWSVSSSTPEERKDRKEYMRVYSKKLRDNNPDYFRDRSLQKNYGVTLEWYNEQLQKQNNVCAICSKPESMRIKGKLVNLAVDHCHDSGEVRGLLCCSCNRAIGLLKHDIELLQSAMRYLTTS